MPPSHFPSSSTLALALTLLVGLGAIALGVWSLLPRPPIIVSPDTIPPQVAAQAINDWVDGHPSSDLAPASSPDPSLYPNPPTPTPASAPVSAPITGPGRLDYLLFRFPRLGEVAVAGDGDWGMLNYRLAAHWHDSPAPGSLGNSLIAFHRGKAFAHASNLHAGDIITIQDRSGHTYTYSIQFTVVVAPTDAGVYFDPIDDGVAHLTMLTCDPYGIWNHRLVIRATLVA